MSGFEQSANCSWLEELSRMFWWDVINKVDVSVEEWLSPDVRIQEANTPDCRGCQGRERIIASLYLLIDQMNYIQCNMEILKMTTMKKNHGSQTRFVVGGRSTHTLKSNLCSEGYNKEEDGQMTIGFVLEWWCNVIVGIIIQRDCDEAFFDESADTVEQPEDGLPMMVYYNTFGYSLSAPFILPKPPHTPSNVVITVLSCENLASRLKRPAPQNVCSFVTVSLGSEKKQTHIVEKSFNPVFTPYTSDGQLRKSHHQPLILEIPDELNIRRSARHGMSSVSSDEEANEAASVTITIEDKRSTWTDRLGNIRIPLSSLKAVCSSGEATPMRIPFTQRRRHFGIRERAGIKSKSSNVDVIDSTQVDTMRLRLHSDDTLVTTRTAWSDSSDTIGNPSSFLNILISKEDANISWLIAELQARDEARKKSDALSPSHPEHEEDRPSVNRSTMEMEPSISSADGSEWPQAGPFKLFLESLFK